MKKRIVSLVLLTAMAMPIVQPIMTEYSPVSYASEETGVQEEYTSELNPVKPSEAADDYLINFKDENLKKHLVEILNLQESKVTVGDLKKLNGVVFSYDIKNSEDYSLEGLQYLPSKIHGIILKNGHYYKDLLAPLKGRLNSIIFDGFKLEEIPKLDDFKEIKIIGCPNNNIKSMENIKFYPNLTTIDMSNNQISDISILKDISNLESLNFSNNNLSDISSIKTSKDSIVFLSFRSNNLNTESIEGLFKDTKFPKLNGNMASIAFAGNHITDFSSIEGNKPQNMYYGNQLAFKVLEEPEFEFPLVNYQRKQREYIVEKIALDQDDNLIKISEDIEDSRYKLSSEAENQDIISFYWNKRLYGYSEPQDMTFSGLLQIVNLIPINDLIKDAEENPSVENIRKVSQKLHEIEKSTNDLRSSELDLKLNKIRDRLNALDTDEYKSTVNPVPASKAKDDQVVIFTDNIFELMVKNAYKREFGESKEVITVGDMRKIKLLSHVLDLDYIKLEESPHTNIVYFDNMEGIQYAENLENVWVYLNGIEEERNYDDNFKLINYKMKLHEKYGDTLYNDRKDGDYYYYKKLWSEEIINDISKENSGRFSPLKDLNKLSSLNIQKSSVNSRDLEEISKIKNLEILDLSQNLISNIGSLKDMKNLKRVYLDFNIIDDISSLDNLEYLESLSLAHNKINNWKPLENKVNLKVLNMNSNRISRQLNNIEENLEVIRKLENIETLLLNDNGITNVEFLSDSTNINQLHLSGNSITDFSSLKNLKRFETDPNSGKRLSAYHQVHFAVLEDNKYTFSFELKNIDGNYVFLDLNEPKDIEIKKLEDSVYQLTDKNAIKVNRRYLNFTDRGQIDGYIYVYNKNKVEELINNAKNDPTEVNIDKANSALDMIYEAPQLREYVNSERAELDSITPQVNPESVSLNKNKLTITAGDKEKLTATVKPENATNKEVTWSSSDDSVAKVDSSGNVEAVKEGKATVTATVKGTNIKASAEVTVNKKEETTPSDDVKATSVTLNSSSSELEKGDTFQLTARVQPNNSTEKGIVWTSSNNSVATVDSNGLVKAVGEGTATIKARVKNSEVSAEAQFTVKEKEENKPVKAESIELDASKIDMYKGQKDKIEAKVKPEKATNKEIEWSSSDDSIVKVDAEGNIEAIGVGTATITAKVKGTDITASVEVVSSEVTAPIDSKFTDIDGHWAKAYIEHSADRGLFKGTTETLFSPEMNMTRGMFVTVLGRLAEETAEPNDKFADVNKEAYYAEYIAWAEENGIVEGYGNGNFGPDNNVTREEMATIIERYMKYKGIELEDNGAAEFADADSISDWAKESVTKIQKAGIIEGKGNGVFDPQTNSTRAEVATLLIRMIEKYID